MIAREAALHYATAVMRKTLVARISLFKSTALAEVPLQKSGTPGSTAASTAPPSADEEASTHLGHLCQSKRAKKTRGGGT